MKSETRTIQCGDRTFQLGTRTYVMGIVNVTPDSFSDGGLAVRLTDAVSHAQQLLEDGADVLDIGGESTRPGAEPVPPAVEIERVIPVVESLVAHGIRNLSIDTRNAETAKFALQAGARWLNDVSALTHDPHMASLAPLADALVLMHARGAPKTMQEGDIQYDEVVENVADFLEERVTVAMQAGMPPARILVDPGIGFGKTLAHNLALTRALSRLRGVSAGVLYGPSRKRFLGELTGLDVPAERDAATLGAICAAVFTGADIVRVHDVKGAVSALRVTDALCRGTGRTAS